MVTSSAVLKSISLMEIARVCWRARMKALFTGLLSAGLVYATQAQAKFIGTTFYMPKVMVEMCKSEIARGQAGFCTGYVIATEEQLAGVGQVCLPPSVEYEDMVRAVVSRIEAVGGSEDIRFQLHVC
jgi:hypothetical protein